MALSSALLPIGPHDFWIAEPRMPYNSVKSQDALNPCNFCYLSTNHRTLCERKLIWFDLIHI